MTRVEGYSSVDERSLDESLPPYSTTWENDVLQDDKKRSQTERATWTDAFDTAKQRVGPIVRTSTRYTTRFVQETAWPAIKNFRFTKKQTYAFLLLLLFGILPFVLMGQFTPGDDYTFFSGVFEEKVIGCGDDFGRPQNSTIGGVEALFVLDQTFGDFLFSQAKTIDVAWDIIMGRGTQLVAWYISYAVFSDALLRLIERHPATFETFKSITLEGACMDSAWALFKELCKKRSKRTWALFFYMLLSTFFVLSIPTFLSAMTGYDSRTIAWVDPDNSGNIVPASYFTEGYLIYGGDNQTFDSLSCQGNNQIADYLTYSRDRRYYCDCQATNGTVVSYQALLRELNWSGYTFADLQECKFNYTGQTQTYRSSNSSWGTQNCNASFAVTVENQTLEVQKLNYTDAWCWEDRAYAYYDLLDSTRCLPDTAHPTYQWGFSTMLSGVFVILLFIWCLTMYIVWQDAQFNSKLVKSGYRMTQLRAAFALTEAAKRKTMLEEGELILAEKKGLEKELYGSKKKKGAKVDNEIFWEDGKVLEMENNAIRKRRRTSSVREL